MKYEGVDIKHGGAAIRFDVYNGQCRLDRELMMRGNLDTSGGRPLSKLDHCGENGLNENGSPNGNPIDYFYWRPAAGAADAANLRSAGTCSIRHNFTRVTPTGLQPTGRLPDGPEIPNRLPECNGAQPEMCLEKLRYNAINTAEGCCEACANLKYLPDNVAGTPCVAFQIVDGKCRILREKFIVDGWGEINKGKVNNVNGNKAMSVTQVIDVCAGFKNHDECARRDNSHGYWGSCEIVDDVSVENDCNYFSHIYYRDLNGEPSFPTPDNELNATYRKIQIVELPEFGFNMTLNVSFINDRTKKRTTLTKAVTGDDLPIGTRPTDTAAGGYTKQHDAETGKDLNSNQRPVDTCAQVSIYLKEPATMHRDLSTGRDVFNPYSIAQPLHVSGKCCQQKESEFSRSDGCLVHLNISTDFVTNARNQQRRRLGSNAQPTVIISYECVGSGKDLCDSEVQNGLVRDAPSQSTTGGAVSVSSTSTVCCEAITLACTACSNGQTPTEYCNTNKESTLCDTSSDDGSIVTPSPSDAVSETFGDGLGDGFDSVGQKLNVLGFVLLINALVVVLKL